MWFWGLGGIGLFCCWVSGKITNNILSETKRNETNSIWFFYAHLNRFPALSLSLCVVLGAHSFISLDAFCHGFYIRDMAIGLLTRSGGDADSGLESNFACTTTIVCWVGFGSLGERGKAIPYINHVGSGSQERQTGVFI